MMCAQCLERMCLSNYYVIQERHRDEIHTEIKLCSTICMREWFE